MRAKNAVACVLLALVLTACTIPSPYRSITIQQAAAVPVDDNGVPIHASGPMTDTQYTVVRGDTLYSIAFRAGVDFRDLARWNHIPAPYVIHPGTSLRITAPPQVEGVPSQPVFQTVSPSAPPPSSTVSPKPVANAQVARATSTTIPVAGEATPPDRPPVAASSVPPAPSRTVGGITWRWPAGGALVDRFNASDAIPGIEIAGHAGDPVRAAASGVVVYSGNGLVGYGELVIIKHNDTYLSAYGHNRERLVREGERVRAGQVIARMGSSGAPRNELEFQIRRDGKPVNPESFLPAR